MKILLPPLRTRGLEPGVKAQGQAESCVRVAGSYSKQRAPYLGVVGILHVATGNGSHMGRMRP